MVLVIVVVEGSARRHLVAALETYAAAYSRNGRAVPADVRTLLDALDSVRSGQGRSEFAAVEDPGEGVVMYSYSTAARRLHVSESTVRRLVKAGELPVVDILNSKRIPASDLDAYVGSLVAVS